MPNAHLDREAMAQGCIFCEMEVIKMTGLVLDCQDNLFFDTDIQNPFAPRHSTAAALASKVSSAVLVTLFCTKFATLSP